MKKDKDIWVKLIQSIPNKNTCTPTGLIDFLLKINTHTHIRSYCNETSSGLLFHSPPLGPPQLPH